MDKGKGKHILSTPTRQSKRFAGYVSSFDRIQEELLKESICTCSSPQKNGSGLPCYGECVAVAERLKLENGSGGNGEDDDEDTDVIEDTNEPREETNQEDVNLPQSQQQRPSCLTFADSIFGQVKFLEERVRTLEKELKENRMEVETLQMQLVEEQKAKGLIMEERKMDIDRLKDELEEERQAKDEKKMEIDCLNEEVRAKTLIIENQKKEVDTLNEEIEEERKTKMILEMKWRRMEKNMINLYAYLGKLIELDSSDGQIFKQLPDKRDKQVGAMNLINRLLQTLTGKIIEAENRIVIRQQEEQLRLQQEAERERELERMRKLEKKMKRRVRFSLNPSSVSTRSRGLMENPIDSNQPSSAGKEKDDEHANRSPYKKARRTEDEDTGPPVLVAEGAPSNIEPMSEVAAAANGNNMTKATEHASQSPSPARILNNEELESGHLVALQLDSPKKRDDVQLLKKKDNEGGSSSISSPRKDAITQKTVRVELTRLEYVADTTIDPTAAQQHHVQKTSEEEDSPNMNRNHDVSHSLNLPRLEIQITEPIETLGHASPSPSPPIFRPVKATTKNTVQKPRSNTVEHGVARSHRKGYHCLCGLTFDNPVCLRAHIRYFTYTLQWNIPCTICHKGFTNLSHLKRHMRNVHDETMPDAVTACRECGIIFSTIWEYKVHRNQVHYKQNPPGGRPVTKIPRGFVRVRNSKPAAFSGEINSKKVEHRRDTSRVYPKNAPRRHPCVCGMDFKLTSGLSSHLSYYTKEWRFMCDLCGDKFPFRGYLRKHMETRHRILVPLEEFTTSKPNARRRSTRSYSKGKSSLTKPILRSTTRTRKVKVNSDSVDEAVVDFIIDNDLT